MPIKTVCLQQYFLNLVIISVNKSPNIFAFYFNRIKKRKSGVNYFTKWHMKCLQNTQAKILNNHGKAE